MAARRFHDRYPWVGRGGGAHILPDVAHQEHHPSAEGEEAECQPGAHDLRSQWLRWTDPGKPPLTVLRWLAVLGIALAWWVQGAPTSPAHTWLPYAVIAGALILPDIAGFAVPGFKLDLKQTQDEIAALRQEVNAQARASSASIIAIGDRTLATITEQLARGTALVRKDQATGPGTLRPPPANGTQPPGDAA